MTEERIELNSGNIVDESLLREGGEANRNIKFVWMGRGGQWEEEVINWPWSSRKAGVGEEEGETSEDKLCAVDMAPSLPSEEGSRRLSDWASQYSVYT